MNPVVVALTENDPSDRPNPPEGYKWLAINKASTTETPYGTITYHFEDPPVDDTPEAPPKNWTGFRLGMLGDAAFLRVVAGGLVIHQASLASEMNQNSPNEPSISAIQLIWNQIVEGLATESAPTHAEIEGWQALADSCNIPIVFDMDGKLL